MDNGNSKSFIQTKWIVIGIIALIGVTLIVVGGVLFLAHNYALEIDTIRDLLLIALAMEALVFGFAFILFLVMVIRLINTIEFEVKPILKNSNHLIQTAKGTTEFVSENIVQPTVKAKGYVSGVKAGAKALVTDPKRNLPK